MKNNIILPLDTNDIFNSILQIIKEYSDHKVLAFAFEMASTEEAEEYEEKIKKYFEHNDINIYKTCIRIEYTNQKSEYYLCIIRKKKIGSKGGVKIFRDKNKMLNEISSIKPFLINTQEFSRFMEEVDFNKFDKFKKMFHNTEEFIVRKLSFLEQLNNIIKF